MKTVRKASEERSFIEKSVARRTAGGFGMRAAKQDAEALLRRAVMTCLLWEDLAYESGGSVAKNIRELIPQVAPEIVAQIAVEAKLLQKLRHVPLYIASVMAGIDTHKHLVGSLLEQIIVRPDEFAEFLAIYWKNGRTPVSAQIKRGLARAFGKFNEYQFAKYRGNRNEIKLRDVLRIVHPKPSNQEQNTLFKKIVTDSLETPDTWEVALSTGKNKKETWERLISERKLGALAFLRNLRNMNAVGVSKKLIREGIEQLNPKWLLPLHFLSAAKYAPEYEQELENLMLKMFANAPKLPGHTVFVVDVSGSMNQLISDKSEFSRKAVAKAMAMVAANLAEKFTLYVTAGNDSTGVHKTVRVAPRRGFGTLDVIEKAQREVGGGGIFTRQCLEYIKNDLGDVVPDRIIIFSDSQDCDRVNKTPKPFGKRNYICDVSAHSHGVAYEGIWDAEISGWSENFINFIMAMEGLTVEQEGQE